MTFWHFSCESCTSCSLMGSKLCWCTEIQRSLKPLQSNTLTDGELSAVSSAILPEVQSLEILEPGPGFWSWVLRGRALHSSVFGQFGLHSYSTEFIHVCIWRSLFIQFVTPHQCHLLTSLKTSHMAASDWSSSTDLHLWSKCQESSPILNWL